ncbi:MAG: hypothetical protein K0S61_680 [Anaerocolumna sp.]|jgi:hypothetical protein|nr:hypothetical protein [Anaerocolumna sp.]
MLDHAKINYNLPKADKILELEKFLFENVFEKTSSELIKREAELIKQKLIGSTGVTHTNDINKPLELEGINKLLAELEKTKIDYIPTYDVNENECIVVDNEEIRKEDPTWQKRGKTIFYHPCNEELIRKF